MVMTPPRFLYQCLWESWGDCELGRGLRRRAKNATEGGAGRFEKPAPDARAAPPEAHESLIGRKTVEEVPLTWLSFILFPRSNAGVKESAVVWSAVLQSKATQENLDHGAFNRENGSSERHRPGFSGGSGSSGMAGLHARRAARCR